MEFFRRAAPGATRLGVLAGAFNPVTVAHMALARAGFSRLGRETSEIVFVLPKWFPHKPYHGAPFADRLEMLGAAVENEPAFSIAASEGGLLVDIAAECRAAYGSQTELTFLCGRDAAERILNWEYGDPEAVTRMLQQFHLLVADRGGDWEMAPKFHGSVEMLALNGRFDHISSTDVRDRIAQGLPWEHLAPEGAHDLVRRVY